MHNATIAHRMRLKFIASGTQSEQCVSMHYVITNLLYQDAKVASKLCMGGPVKYMVWGSHHDKCLAVAICDPWAAYEMMQPNNLQAQQKSVEKSSLSLWMTMALLQSTKLVDFLI